MAQVKKTEVRAAIMAAALRLIRKRGYMETTLNDIAAAAKTSRANIYVYFPSKFALFYAVFDPWLNERLAVLERELAAIAEPHAMYPDELADIRFALARASTGPRARATTRAAELATQARARYLEAGLDDARGEVVDGARHLQLGLRHHRGHDGLIGRG